MSDLKPPSYADEPLDSTTIAQPIPAKSLDRLERLLELFLKVARRAGLCVDDHAIRADQDHAGVRLDAVLAGELIGVVELPLQWE